VAWVSGAILAYTNLLLASAMFSLWSGAAPIVEEYAWTNALFTLEFGFSADGLSLPVAMIVNLVCNALVIFSIEYLDHRVHAIYNRGSNSLNAFYYSLFMLFSTGLLGISFATNLIEVYIFLDFLLIPLYFIMDHFGYVTRHRVATMCFLWGFIAGALFLLGSVLAYSQTGSFMISDLPALVGTPMAFWAAFLMLLGILVKLAVFGSTSGCPGSTPSTRPA
jgi:NADH-quinone oxidoreductase subunit M